MAHKIQTTDLSAFRKLSPAQGAAIYAVLKTEVTRAGILDRDYGFYTLLTALTFGGFGLSIYEFTVRTHLAALIFWGAAIAFFTVQVGGLIHDSGHRAVFKSSRNNDIFGTIASILVIFGYINWRETHNTHHAHPNEEGTDPDLGIPWAFTADRYKNASGFKRLFLKYQMYFYYPLGTFAIVLTRFGNLKYYLQNWHKKGVRAELAVFILGVGVWYVIPFLIFPLGKALLFIFLTNNLTSLYLINVFAPNHKGMPQLGKNVQFSFLEQQIVTARNIYGHALTDYVYLCLNYQIEHHLFPNCPRNKLKLVTPFVLALCHKYHLAYTQASVLESNRFILRELKQISAAK